MKNVESIIQSMKSNFLSNAKVMGSDVLEYTQLELVKFGFSVQESFTVTRLLLADLGLSSGSSESVKNYLNGMMG